MFRAAARGFLIAVTLLAGSAHAAWPERTVTIVTPYAAGGIADVVARLTAERLQSALKQNFVVENQTGAAGTAAPGTRRQGHARRLHADVDADLPAHDGEVRAERHLRRATRFHADLGGRLRAIRHHGRTRPFPATRSPNSSPT